MRKMLGEVHHLSPDLQLWQHYDPRIKADLYSTAIGTSSGVYLVDPIPLDPTSFAELIRGRRIAGIVLTNANHTRAAQEYARRFKTSVYAHREAVDSAGSHGLIAIGEGLPPEAGMTVVTIEGAAPGERALHRQEDGGTLIVGDALINFGAHGFTLLPAKYCSDPPRMRASLRKLLSCEFERILFAHGMPIIANGRERLEGLLDRES